jgi:signal transduction histidine kinase
MIIGRIGIRVHILLTVVGVVVAGFAVIYFVSRPLFENALAEERVTQDKWLAKSLAKDLAAGNDPALKQLHRWERAMSGICLALVRENTVKMPTHNQILGNGARRLALCVGRAQVVRIASLQGGSHRTIEHAGTRVLAVSTTVPKGPLTQKEGPLHLLYASTIAGGGRSVIPGTLILLFMVLAVALVTLLGYAVLTQLIVRPVGRLLNTMERVTFGDLEARSEVGGGREMRSLQEAFNRLVSTLAADEARIKEQIRELQLINQKLERTTDSLVRSEKMASVGRLAAGVAHEIGNPVSIVQGYMEMMKRPDVSLEEMTEWVAQSSAAVDRVDAIIRDLLDFSRPAMDDEPLRCDVRDAIEQTLNLLRPQKSFQHIEVSLTLCDEAVTGAISEKRFQQVLVNILINAAAATRDVAGGGRVSIEVTLVDSQIQVSIADNGPGLTKDAQRHLFEPFFSTKEPGEGTGLGLAICYSIMTNCGGDISVAGAGDKGCTFVLAVPAAKAS